MFGFSRGGAESEARHEQEMLKKRILDSIIGDVQVFGLRGLHGADTGELIKRLRLLRESVNYFNDIILKEPLKPPYEAQAKLLGRVEIIYLKIKKFAGYLSLIQNPAGQRRGKLELQVPESLETDFKVQREMEDQEFLQSKQLVLSAAVNLRHTKKVDDFNYWISELRNRILSHNKREAIVEEHPYKFYIEKQVFHINHFQIKGQRAQIILGLYMDQTGKFSVEVDSHSHFPPEVNDPILEHEIEDKLAGVTVPE